ncbi:hypothetical protein SLS53_000980 [Cytospora paraplurivora]|uniref:Uncharacterized protein n=1 Tax=Cytospora paraplurivora TaxID=2898453 RepID=A0AAN9YNR5_9PEZI
MASISSNPGPKVHITTHNDEGKAVVKSTEPVKSLDYGIVMEGSVVALFDSGEEQVMHRGDVMVQRATMHAWKNKSEKDWARMLFCLQDTKPLFVGEERFKEAGIENLPPSGNDD